MEIKWIAIAVAIILSMAAISGMISSSNKASVKQSCFEAQTKTQIDLKCNVLE